MLLESSSSRSVASGLVLHYLPMSHKKDAMLKWVNKGKPHDLQFLTSARRLITYHTSAYYGSWTTMEFVEKLWKTIDVFENYFLNGENMMKLCALMNIRSRLRQLYLIFLKCSTVL